MLQTFVSVVHVGCCLFLILVILVQQGRGGGLAALGGGTTQVFGGRGAGDLLTRTTAILASIFMITNISLAYLASSGDRSLRQRSEQQEKEQEAKKVKPAASGAATSTPSGAPAGVEPTPAGSTPPK